MSAGLITMGAYVVALEAEASERSYDLRCWLCSSSVFVMGVIL